jgi:hypothetical protein
LELSKYRPVLTKKDFVDRYSRGEFGNHATTWLTLRQYHISGYCGLVHLRSRVAGGPTYYNLTSAALWITLNKVSTRSDYLNWYVSAMAPTSKTLFQGEVTRGLWGLELTYTHVAKPMREALEQSTRTTRGLEANLLLQHYLCPNSWDWMNVLLERYNDHVVEFSTYSEQWGTLPGYNTVFWEVRKY